LIYKFTEILWVADDPQLSITGNIKRGGVLSLILSRQGVRN